MGLLGVPIQKPLRNNMTDTSFLANVEREGNLNVRSDEEKDITPDSPTEKNQEDESAPPAEKKGEGETPNSEKGEKPEVFHAFHEHPRWLQAQEELKELRTFREKAEPLLEQLGKSPEKREETTKIPRWFITVFGENQEAWDQYREYDQAERKKLVDQITGSFKEEQRRISEEDKRVNEKIDKDVQAIVENKDFLARAKEIGFDFSNKDQLKNFRNELMQSALDYEITNLEKAFDILEYKKLKGQQAKPVSRNKEIADKTIQKGKADGEKKNYKTSHDLANLSFRDLIPDED